MMLNIISYKIQDLAYLIKLIILNMLISTQIYMYHLGKHSWINNSYTLIK